jgi:hypothetical protein
MLLTPGGAIERLPLAAKRVLLARAIAVDAGVAEGLLARVDAHVARATEALGQNEFLNIELARRIAVSLKLLLGGYAALPSDHACALVVGAAWFLLDAHDLVADMESPLGFDDDALVLNAVLADIGGADLVIQVG